MTDFVSEAHERLIGEHPEPVRIDAEQQVQIVRDERVGEMAPITLPVQEVGALPVINRIAGWIALGGAVLGLLMFIAGVMMRPERGEFTQAVAIGSGRARGADRAVRLHRARGRAASAVGQHLDGPVRPARQRHARADARHRSRVDCASPWRSRSAPAACANTANGRRPCRSAATATTAAWSR